jgi:hypothetical protein
MTGIETVSGFLVAVRQTSPRVFLAVAIATGIILFSSPEFATTLGMVKIRAEYRSQLGITFLVSLSVVAVAALYAGVGWIKAAYKTYKVTKRRTRSLEELTPDEKGYLAPYVLDHVNTQLFQIEDGIAAGLAAKNIIYRPSNIFDMVEGFSYNIQPWAKKRLTKRPHLLEGATKPKKSRRDRI